MIHGLLEFVREQLMQWQWFARPGVGHSPATTSSQSQHHLSEPQAAPR